MSSATYQATYVCHCNTCTFMTVMFLSLLGRTEIYRRCFRLLPDILCTVFDIYMYSKWNKIFPNSLYVNIRRTCIIYSKNVAYNTTDSREADTHRHSGINVGATAWLCDDFEVTLGRCQAITLTQSFHILTLVLPKLDILCLCKQCRSRSVGFWRSQLIWIRTVCH